MIDSDLALIERPGEGMSLSQMSLSQTPRLKIPSDFSPGFININYLLISVKQFNPNCEMLDGFRKEECEFNRENSVMILCCQAQAQY